MRSSIFRRLVILFVVLTGPDVCSLFAAERQAQAVPAVATAPPVETLVERALAQAQSLAARRARVEAAQSARKAAGTLPDPMVEFEYRDFNFPRYTIGSDPMSMAGVGVRQNLMSKGRRAAEREVAQSEIGVRRAEQEALAAQLSAEVRVQYARLYALDCERETLVDAQELVAMIEATASSRYAAGESDQATILRAQLERTRLGQRLIDNATRRFAAQTILNRLTNDPPERAIGVVSALPDPSLPPALAAGALLEGAAAQAPEVVVRQREMETASRQVNAARQELRPAWSLGAGLYWQGGFDRTVTFNVGLELPFRKDRRQRPMIAAAEQTLRASELELQDAEAEVQAEVARLLNEWRAASEQIDRYRTALLPQNSAAFDATRSSYLTGRGDFASVLEEFRRWIDLRTELAGREAERYEARARLEALVGSGQVQSSKSKVESRRSKASLGDSQ